MPVAPTLAVECEVEGVKIPPGVKMELIGARINRTSLVTFAHCTYLWMWDRGAASEKGGWAGGGWAAAEIGEITPDEGG